MSYRRNGLKALGLSFLAALGLMVFMAGSAQANWLVPGGTELGAGVTKAVEVAKHTNGKLIVSGLNLEVRCETLAASGLNIIGGNATTATAEGKVSFGTCETYSPPGGALQSKCTPSVQPIVAGGKAKVILHNTKNYVLFEQKTGETKFARIEFPETCALTESNNVTGSVAAECGKLVSEVFTFQDCNVAEVTHLLRPVSAELQTALGDSLKFGLKEAKLEGIASVKLVGGASWSGEV